MTQADMMAYIYDPMKIQMNILEQIDMVSNNTLVISDPTNPFTMLLESSAVTASSAATEQRALLRKTYPNLALNVVDLLPHLSDTEIENMFAVPSEANIVFYISVIDLSAKGNRVDVEGTSNYYMETILPMYTEVNILGVIFTLLNDIVIRLYNTGTVFVEQQPSLNDIGVNDLGILNNSIISDSNAVPFIIFETKLKQVKRTSYTGTIIAGEGFTSIQTITSDYYYSVVSYQNAATNNTPVILYKSLNEEYVDPTKPSCFIAVNGTNILYRIPDVYIIDGTISGIVNIDTYETQGQLYLPINKYTLQDFNVVLGNSTTSVSASTITNIPVLANSRDIVNGGINAISLDSLRASIISNTTGEIVIPVTFAAIQQLLSYTGFDVYKALDIITERMYIAVQNTPDVSSSLILSRQDLFFNTATLALNNLLTNTQVYVDNLNDVFIIKSGTVFKEENSIITIIDSSELTAINLMANADKVTYFSDKNYYYTPYYYIVDQVDSAIKTRVYDLDSPNMQNLKITYKNNSIMQNVNINAYTVQKLDTGYRVLVSLITDTNFDKLDITTVKAQLHLPLLGNTTIVSFEGNIYITDGLGGYRPYITSYGTMTGADVLYIGFDLNTDLYINDNDNLLITNGYSDIYTKLIYLASTAIFYIYTNDPTINNTDLTMSAELYKPVTNSIVLSKEEVLLTLGNKLEYIWNRMYTTYSERKYKHYTVAQPAVYEQDIYDVSNSSSITVNNGSLVYTIVHHKGDPILDASGNPTYIYNIGDTMLDTNGMPIIDNIGGVIRYIDIFMIEYEYKLANSLSYQNYLLTTLDLVKNWLLVTLPDVNNKMIENTEVLLKSYKTAKDVNISINNTAQAMRYVVTPIVTLYTNNKSYTTAQIDSMRDTIGSIIHKYLDNTVINLANIKLDIINTINNGVIGVKISGLDEFGGMETFTVIDNTARLVLDKVLAINLSNELIVRYNIDLTVQTI